MVRLKSAWRNTLTLASPVLVSSAMGPSRASSPQPPPLTPCPHWISTAASGHIATGLIAVRTDPRDSCSDLFVACGNDQWPQPLTRYYNQARGLDGGVSGRVPFGSRSTAPQWQGALNAFHGPVASGDINGDGLVDLVAATIFQPSVANGLYFPGGLIIHWGAGCEGSKAPHCRGGAFLAPPLNSFEPRFSTIPRDLSESPTPFASGHYNWALALGDVNADGRPDIIAGDLFDPAEQPISIREMRRAPPPPGRLRVHLQRAHGFDDTPDWVSTEAGFVGALEVADMNGDGLLDLVAGSWPPRIYFGRLANGEVALEKTASWTGSVASQDGAETAAREYALGIDVGWWGQPPQCAPVAADNAPVPLIAVATGCVFGHGTETACEGRLSLFDWRSGGGPIWRSEWRGSANDVAIADLDGDGLADLVSSAWSERRGPLNTPGRLRIFGGRPGAAPAFDEGLYASATTFVGQQLVVSDLRGERTTATHCSIPPEANPEGTTFMLSAHNLEAITAIDVVAPNGEIQRLEHDAYFTSTGSSVFTLRSTRPSGSTLRVHYDVSDRPSVAVAGLEVEVDCDEVRPSAGQPAGTGQQCSEARRQKGAVLYFENINAAGEGLRCGDRPGVPPTPAVKGSN